MNKAFIRKYQGPFLAMSGTLFASLASFLVYSYFSSFSTRAGVVKKFNYLDVQIKSERHLRETGLNKINGKMKRFEQAFCLIEKKTCDLFKE